MFRIEMDGEEEDFLFDGTEATNSLGAFAPPHIDWEWRDGFHIFWHFKKERKWRFRLSVLTFFPYFVVNALVNGNAAVWTIFVLPRLALPEYERFFMALVWIGAVLGSICYFVAWITNPGILPYDWSVRKMHPAAYSLDDLKAGIAITGDQKSWGKSHEVPARAFFSGRVGVIILKADHFCEVIQHWIGLYNMRFFIQAVFYGIIYCLVVSTTTGYALVQMGLTRASIIPLFCLIVGVYFIPIHLLQIRMIWFKIVHNTTFCEWHLHRDRIDMWNLGLCGNLKEIFGSWLLFPLWFLPIPLPLERDGMDFEIAEDLGELAKLIRDGGSMRLM
jgi:hypothetical protein